MLSLLLSTSCLLDISTNIVRISLLGFSFFCGTGDFFASFLPSLFVDVDGINDPKMTSFLGSAYTKNPVFPSAKNLKVDHPRN